jgi:hypothetical protein
MSNIPVWLKDLFWVISSFLVFARLIDEVLSRRKIHQLKELAVKWWVSISDLNFTKINLKVADWITTFFNKIYGKKHLSRRCFFYSILSSFIFLVIITTLYLALTYYHIPEDIRPPVPWGNLLKTMVSLLLIFLMYNIIPGYISLIQTRYILSKSNKFGIIYFYLFIVLDFVLTRLIFLVWFSIFWFFTDVFMGRAINFERIIYESKLIIIFPLKPIFVSYGNFEFDLFYSIFLEISILSAHLTSLIFYLLFVTTLIIKMTSKVNRLFSYVLEKLSETKTPTTVITSFFCLFIVLFVCLINLIH